MENKNLTIYYKETYFKDLERFKKSCLTDKYSKDAKQKLFFVGDLEDWFKKNDITDKEKRYFIYFLITHTALLMVVHEYFKDKYADFKKENKGLVFEYGLTNTFITPKEIFTRFSVLFNRELLGNCFEIVLDATRQENKLCGIEYGSLVRCVGKDKELKGLYVGTVQFNR